MAAMQVLTPRWNTSPSPQLSLVRDLSQGVATNQPLLSFVGAQVPSRAPSPRLLMVPGGQPIYPPVPVLVPQHPQVVSQGPIAAVTTSVPPPGIVLSPPPAMYSPSVSPNTSFAEAPTLQTPRPGPVLLSHPDGTVPVSSFVAPPFSARSRSQPLKSARSMNPPEPAVPKLVQHTIFEPPVLPNDLIETYDMAQAAFQRAEYGLPDFLPEDGASEASAPEGHDAQHTYGNAESGPAHHGEPHHDPYVNGGYYDEAMPYHPADAQHYNQHPHLFAEPAYDEWMAPSLTKSLPVNQYGMRMVAGIRTLLKNGQLEPDTPFEHYVRMYLPPPIYEPEPEPMYQPMIESGPLQALLPPPMYYDDPAPAPSYDPPRRQSTVSVPANPPPAREEVNVPAADPPSNKPEPPAWKSKLLAKLTGKRASIAHSEDHSASPSPPTQPAVIPRPPSAVSMRAPSFAASQLSAPDREPSFMEVDPEPPRPLSFSSPKPAAQPSPLARAPSSQHSSFRQPNFTPPMSHQPSFHTPFARAPSTTPSFSRAPSSIPSVGRAPPPQPPSFASPSPLVRPPSFAHSAPRTPLVRPPSFAQSAPRSPFMKPPSFVQAPSFAPPQPPAPKPPPRAPKPAPAAPPPEAVPIGPDGQPVSPRTHMAMMAFERFDLDNSGNLDVEEFYKAMQALGMGYSFEDAENLFNMMDEDGNGEMSMEEFLTHCREYITNSAQAAQMEGEDAEARIRQVFQRYDNYGQGYLEVADFWPAVRDLGLGMSEEDAVHAVEMLDADGSGAVSEQEFFRYCLNAMQGGGAASGPMVHESVDPVIRQGGPLVLTGNPEVDAVTCFRRFDEDGNGYLDIYEFMRAMKELGLPMSFQEAKSLFSQIDVDGSGTMEEEEFTTHYINYIVKQRRG